MDVARVCKTPTEVARRSQSQQCKALKGAEHGEYLFGSISPRGGCVGQIFREPPFNTIESQRDTTESDNNISSCSTLDIINKVEQLPTQQLELQIRDLTQRLQQSETQKNSLQRQLEECTAAKEVSQRRLDVMSAAHECRITEMHCVIAELSKKLRAKQDHIILEEQEPDGSEISFQQGSVYNSELNLTNPEAECETEPLVEVAFMDHTTENDYIHNIQNEYDDEQIKVSPEAINKGQVGALQEEVLHLRGQIALLQSQIATSMRTSLTHETTVEEQQKIEYYADDFDANNSNKSSLEEQLCAAHKAEETLNDLNISRADFMTPCETVTSPTKRVAVVAKKAQRVKLHCASKGNLDHVDLLQNKLKNSIFVEHLTDDLQANNNILDGFIEPSKLESELQRQQRKVENLKINNSLLSLTLDESKEHTERLYLLCGKYESNAVALQLALNCSDRAIEAYDVMLALLESKLALINDKTSSAEENRKAVEYVARHLLNRLENEKDVCENSFGPWQNTFNIPDSAKSCAPWTAADDNRLRYHVSKLKGRRSGLQNTIVDLESPFNDLFEKKRLALEEGKDLGQEKQTQYDLEMTVLMQELFNLREENINLKTKIDESEREQKLGNERIAVLQDAIKHLQLQMQLARRLVVCSETDSMDSSFSKDCYLPSIMSKPGHQNQPIQLTSEPNALFHQQQQKQENRISYSEAEHAALTEQQLVEALTRETELKGRIQTLIATVTATQKVSDEKYEQLHQNVCDLQKANQNLGQMLDQNKRKYQQRIRKLEQRITELKLDFEERQNVGLLKHKSVAKSSLQNNVNVPETTL